jgi:hypothetical protein
MMVVLDAHAVGEPGPKGRKRGRQEREKSMEGMRKDREDSRGRCIEIRRREDRRNTCERGC